MAKREAIGRDETKRPTRGGRLLERWIRKHYGSIPAFCEAEGFERIQVQRVVNGDRWKRVSVDFAFEVSRVTRGAIPLDAFRSATAMPHALP